MELKKYIILFSFLLCAQTSIGQITIDSFHVYHTGATVDSLYIQGTKSSSQKLDRSTFAPFNDKCGTIYGSIIFRDCYSNQSTSYDTVLIYGFPSTAINISSFLDTFSTCSVPANPMRTDSLFWDNCSPTKVNDFAELSKSILVYPNPAKNFIQISKPDQLEIKGIQLLSLTGIIIQDYHFIQNQIFIDSDISPGIYFLKISTEKGILTKKIVIE